MNDNKNKLTIPLVIATIVFYLSTVLPHETVGGKINSWFEGMSRAQYDNTILIILSIGVFVYSLVVFRSLFKHKTRLKKGLFYLFITLIFCVIAMRYLIVINIESIHFLQYGILSILVFHVVKRYDYTIWIILLMGFFDECYQHFYLTPNRFAHLDFNDMFLDLIGGGFGLSSLYCLHRPSGPKSSLIRRSILGVYLTLIAIFVILWGVGIIRIWPSADQELAPIQIMHQEIKGFWTTVRKVHQYHIMRPLEGLIILLATTLFYSRLDEDE